MVYNTQNYWVSGLCPSFGIIKNTTFRKLDLFPSSDEGVGDAYSVLTNRGQKQIQFPKHSVLLCSLEYQMMDRVQKKPAIPNIYSTLLYLRPPYINTTIMNSIPRIRNSHLTRLQNLNSNTKVTRQILVS
jgi:hypothetical protein